MAEAPPTTTTVKPFLALPYIIGTVWALLLPTASILSGDFARAREWYVDENSLETSNMRSDYRFQNVSWSDDENTDGEIFQLCDVLARYKRDKNNIECHKYRHESRACDSFDLVKIIPTGSSFEPSNEAIALVAPYPSAGDWTVSHLHFLLLELLRRLASTDSSPWLAKTIILISPTSSECSLHKVVDVFLLAYGGNFQSTLDGRIEQLPPVMSDAMIRNLLVLDSRPSKDPGLPNNEVRILPQGNLGVLPNMDLAFVTVAVFSRSPIAGDTRRTGSDSPKLLMHPYSVKTRQWEGFVKDTQVEYLMDQRVEKWAIDLGNLALFCQNLFQGPIAPHALALNRGIDSVTIQGRYSTLTHSKPSVLDYVQKLEITIRGLSNLQEQLHHSTSLYLLPSPLTFVKHEEYLVPNLLLLMAIVLRAVLLALADIRRFDLQVMWWMLLTLLGTTLWFDFYVAQKDPAQRKAWSCVLYLTCFGVLHEKVLKVPRDHQNALQCTQLVVCLVAIYCLIPICFGSVAVSFPSAFFFTPCIAFPAFSSVSEGKNEKLLMVSFLFYSWPPVSPINYRLFSSACTPSLRFLYSPLHLAMSLSCALGMLRTNIKEENVRK